MLRSPPELAARDHERCGAAIVTGAAGGIGLATARHFAQSERPLVLSDLDQGALQAATQDLAAKCRLTLVPGDITELDYPGTLLAARGGQPMEESWPRWPKPVAPAR